MLNYRTNEFEAQGNPDSQLRQRAMQLKRRPNWNLFVGLFSILAFGMQSGQAATKPLAGWYGAFPYIDGYQHSFEKPKVSAPTQYEQTAKYMWTGNALKEFSATILRGQAPALRSGQKTQQMTVSGYSVRIQEVDDTAGDAMHEHARAVVDLANNKYLLIKASGAGPWEPLKDIVAKFNFKRIESALSRSPRTSQSAALNDFKLITQGSSYQDLIDWVGLSNRDIGSGIHIMVYQVEGKELLVGTPDFKTVVYVHTMDGNDPFKR